ncbi:CLUMA_CG018566, isoform A [Clunio marinus]|uniref:CLUMA_CG018566, isoform A n=1 Tax=Clunio marinus TaxID=568069 RepID=A0A1J1IZM2_9DIPT|nr:CLUMA_CG018566, isoform A [Clunio marinus]
MMPVTMKPVHVKINVVQLRLHLNESFDGKKWFNMESFLWAYKDNQFRDRVCRASGKFSPHLSYAVLHKNHSRWMKYEKCLKAQISHHARPST